MRRIRSCTCFEIHSRPGRHVRRQNRRQPARCQRIIVAGRTTTRASRHLKNRDSNAKPTRSLDRCTAASRRVRRIRRVAGAASGSPRPGRLAAGPRAVQSRPDPSLTAGRFGTARSRVDDVIFVWRTLNCANCINAEHRVQVPQPAPKHYFKYAGATYASFRQYQRGSGQDKNSLMKNPLLLQPAYAVAGSWPKTQFVPQSGSPAIDGGTDVCVGIRGCLLGTVDFRGVPLRQNSYWIGAVQ